MHGELLCRGIRLWLANHGVLDPYSCISYRASDLFTDISSSTMDQSLGACTWDNSSAPVTFHSGRYISISFLINRLSGRPKAILAEPGEAKPAPQPCPPQTSAMTSYEGNVSMILPSPPHLPPLNTHIWFAKSRVPVSLSVCIFSLDCPILPQNQCCLNQFYGKCSEPVL